MPTDEPQHDAMHALQRDIACPQCEYNLRGLVGDVVQCPECGMMVDVAKLITQKWEKPWWQAPGFNTLLLPVTWNVIGGIACMIGFAVAINALAIDEMFAMMGLFVFYAGVWGFLMMRAYRVFDDMKGVWLAIAAHPLMLGYAAAVMAVIISVISGINIVAGGVTVVMDGDYAEMRMDAIVYVLVNFAIPFVFGVGALWVCRKVERYIAEQCIRRYLQRVTGAG